ncbi:restriction endonuclease subunit S [Thioalkalivibrio sp.]|uniref:restriction endonuclease subunit S n=1 Tax=Thioalkalivibrio sp. TaxID=2093813 RepID=UPI003975FE31
MTFPRYPEYKGSGVGWLGEVPAHWEVKPLKHVATYNDDVLPESTPDNFEIKYVEISDVDEHRGVVGWSVHTFASAPSRARRVLRPGDVLISTVRTYLRAIAPVIQPPANLIGSTGFAVIRPVSTEFRSGLLGYALRAECFISEVISRSVGVSYPAINASDLVSIQVPVPPLAEQLEITSFLGHQTAKIDKLIEEQRRLIELLKEKRQAVISHAVTKGLDPNVPMKDSGVEWLGEVPAHWEVGKIRYFARLESGHTPSRNHPEYWENCTVPWFTLADVWQIRSGEVTEVCDTSEKVSELGLAHSSARVLPKGTVMLSRTASVGFSAIMGRDMATTQDFANWVCEGKLDSRYLLFCFRAMKEEFSRLMRGSTHKTIYMPDIAELMCAVPPLHEQRKIVKAIEERLSATRSLIETATNAVSLLGERRSSLISAAVTGKIDVRGWSAGAEAEAPELAMVAEESAGYSAQGGAA